MTHNKVTQGDTAITGGVYEDKSWDDRLVFKRVSWHYGVSLYYDAFMTEIGPSNPFFQWFSEKTKTELSSCQHAILAVTYSFSSKKIGHALFSKEMSNQGYEVVNTLNFQSHLKNHPDYRAWNLNLYKVKAFCKKSNVLKESQLTFNFPGFSQTQIKI
jgi:hypothetical protein